MADPAFRPGPSAALIVNDGRITLRIRDDLVPLTALEIFQAAVRGRRELHGHAIDPDIEATTGGIVFHQEPAAVALLVSQQGDLAVAIPVIRTHGRWSPINLKGGADHVLLDRDWYPLDRGSLEAIVEWCSRWSTRPIDTAAYVDLYRASGPGFEIVDLLDDRMVDELTGGSGAPRDLVLAMYPYQAAGLRWLSARADARLGGILADQMGLGKTLQIIALLAQRAAGGAGPSLIVVPLTLVETWIREFLKFAPGLNVYRHVGPHRTRRPQEIQRQSIVLTTYETAVIDEAVLSLVEWDSVILDEAQVIKNPEALRSRVMASMPRQSGFAVTGTPLENRTLDMWSIASFALPGYLGSRADFADRLEEDPDGLRRSIRPLLLRREVAQVANDLPDRIDIDVALEMFDPERELYDRLRSELRDLSESRPVLALITRLRQFTAHPDMLYGIAPGPEARSAKLTRLSEILDEILSSGEKALVFVAFTKGADMILRLTQQRFGVPAWTIDGRTPARDRHATIDAFTKTKDGSVLVLNPAAAGVGLNIQAATHVVHFTLEWNPAREAQATARAWRRGQSRPVTVHRLYYTNTIDEFILEKLRIKQELFDTVVRPTDDRESGLRELLGRTLSTDVQ